MIPKRKQAVGVWKFRPISLCNMVYKLVSTVVANRLKLVLPHVMSYSQSAFVPRRQITDNVLVAYELVHFLRRKRKGKQGFMSIKVNINKAYDQVEWSYLDRVMELMSFWLTLISLIMSFVSSTSFLVLINGNPKDYIIPSWGFRERDSLSP